MPGRTEAGEIISGLGFHDHKWLPGSEIVVKQWVRMKCLYGCPNFGTRGTCPPNVPSIEMARELFAEYREIAIIHIRDNVDNIPDHREWSRVQNRKLLELERKVFIGGFPRALVLYVDGNCICDECAGGGADCTDRAGARPSPESLGVDVFTTVEKCGFPIHVMKEQAGEMDRYAFLLLS